MLDSIFSHDIKITFKLHFWREKARFTSLLRSYHGCH